MFNLDNITVKNDNKDWPYRKLIIGPSGSGKTNYLLTQSKKITTLLIKLTCMPKIWKNQNISF